MADEDGSFEIPAAFWRELSNQEMHTLLVVRNGRLSHKQTLRAWRLAGCPGEKPTGPVQAFFSRDEVMKAFPPPTRH